MSPIDNKSVLLLPMAWHGQIALTHFVIWSKIDISKLPSKKSGCFLSYVNKTQLPDDLIMQDHKSSTSWWCHQMETFCALLAICAGNSPVPSEFPTRRPVTRNFDVFLDLRLNKRLSKQLWGRWFESLLHPLWRHRNDTGDNGMVYTTYDGAHRIALMALCHVVHNNVIWYQWWYDIYVLCFTESQLLMVIHVVKSRCPWMAICFRKTCICWQNVSILWNST